jgi:hypothetical protein
MDVGAEGEAALVKIDGGGSPSPARPWGLALCARVPLVFLLRLLLASGTRLAGLSLIGDAAARAAVLVIQEHGEAGVGKDRIDAEDHKVLDLGRNVG